MLEFKLKILEKESYNKEAQQKEKEVKKGGITES